MLFSKRYIQQFGQSIRTGSTPNVPCFLKSVDSNIRFYSTEAIEGALKNSTDSNLSFIGSIPIKTKMFYSSMAEQSAVYFFNGTNSSFFQEGKGSAIVLISALYLKIVPCYFFSAYSSVGRAK